MLANCALIPKVPTHTSLYGCGCATAIFKGIKGKNSIAKDHYITTRYRKVYTGLQYECDLVPNRRSIIASG